MPPNPHPFRLAQPDGKAVHLRIRGAARFNWFEDTNGFPVVRTERGVEYATVSKQGILQSTGLKVGDVNPHQAGLKKGVIPSPPTQGLASAGGPLGLKGLYGGGGRTAQPFGEVRNLVVLIRFADHEEREIPPPEDIDVLFNERGGDNEKAPTGSVRDYYLENSYGQLTLESTVIPWITLPESEAYYADGYSGMGTRFKEALQDALELVEPLVDFAEFDEDQNGWIDAITFLHSGYGAEWGADAMGAPKEERIWSHRGGIPIWTSEEGVRVMDYSVTSCLWGVSGSRLTRIGVIVHELGHFFGLPDLYDTDGSSHGVGSWCGMANAWGWSGDQFYPPQFSAYCKVKLGWVKPVMITEAGNYFLEPVEKVPVIGMITNGFPAREYLLLENRQALGFDIEIEQGGLAVWHVDEAKYNNDEEGFPGQAGWPQNNNHYRVALLQADGAYDLERNTSGGDAGDLYAPGTGAMLNPETLPGTESYSGGNIARTPIWIQTLPAEGSSVAFNFQTERPGVRITSARLNEGAMELTVSGPPGTSCAILSSEDTVEWRNFFSTVIPASGQMDIIDPVSATAPQQFYRLAP